MASPTQSICLLNTRRPQCDPAQSLRAATASEMSAVGSICGWFPSIYREACLEGGMQIPVHRLWTRKSSQSGSMTIFKVTANNLPSDALGLAGT